MARSVVLDVLLLTARVPAALPTRTVARARRTLASPAFAAALRRAVRDTVRAVPALTPVRLTVAR